MQSRSKVLGFLWLGILFGIILTGAYFLFLIPGIIFTIWFFFAVFILIAEDVRGMNALLKSKEYVRGQWWGVFGRLFLVWFLSLLVSLIPMIGQILFLFVMAPFAAIYSVLLYEELKASKPAMTFSPTSKAKATILATGLVGFCVPIILFVVMGAMFVKFLPKFLPQVAPFLMQQVLKSGQPQIQFQQQPSPQLAPSQTAQMSADPVADAIQKLKQKDLSPNEKGKAIDTLVSSKDSRAVPALIECLQSDPDASLRAAAADALGTLKDKRAIEPLKKALKDKAAIRTLDAKERLLDVAIVSERAGKSLRRMGVSKVLLGNWTKLLIQQLREKDPKVRQNAISYLDLEPAAIPQLKKLLKDKNLEVSRQAAASLNNIFSDLGKTKDAEAMQKREQELLVKIKEENERKSKQSAEAEQKTASSQETSQPVQAAPVKITAVTSDGTPFTGTLIENDGSFITIKTRDGDETPLPISELTSINGQNPKSFLKRYPLTVSPKKE